MNYNEFLTEIRRSVGVAPQKEDPKAKTTAMRQKLRDTGDVGLKDTVAQVTGKPVTSAQQYNKAGKKIATAATGVEFGDTADPIDAALDKVRGPARYQALEKEKAAAYGLWSALPVGQQRLVAVVHFDAVIADFALDSAV